MALLEKSLTVKRSGLPGAGKGLFTKDFIPKGTRIIEYKGKATTWNEVKNDNGVNRYLYYINRNHVIDARNYKKSKARYANYARVLKKLKGVKNNAWYTEEEGRVFIESKMDIPPGAEILVDYGKEYWDVIRHNGKSE